MITPGYVQMMARYNAWQNNQLMRVIKVMDQAELDAERGAFFGSIQKTLNHILWGDQAWLARFDSAYPAPSMEGGIAATTGFCADKGDWAVARDRCDGEIEQWAKGIEQGDLAGDLTWYSGTVGHDMTMPMAICVAHLFNHQTHHRGQVHAMLTAAGQQAPVSDLPFMPEG